MLLVGPPDDAADAFDCFVCSPRWLADHVGDGLGIDREGSAVEDWATAATRIGRVFPWEFQYRYDRFVDVHPDRFAIPPWNNPSHRPHP